MELLKKIATLFAVEEPGAAVDASGKLLVYFGIAITGQEFAAGLATAVFGQVAISLNDRPQTVGEAARRLIGTILCAMFAAMCSGLPIVKSIPTVVLMGLAGAFSMTLLKILDAFKKKADNSADAAADKIMDGVKNKLGG